jgi:hypothetical protein
MNRKAVEYWGRKPARPDLAYVDIDSRHQRRVVTWAEVMEARRERQRKRLDLIRQVIPWRAYRIWVSYFDQWLMGGWHAFLDDWRGDGYRIWIDRDCRHMKVPLMTAFPLVLPLGSEHEQWDHYWKPWEQWKVEFAQNFERRRHDRRPVGVAYVWWNGRDTPRPIRQGIAHLASEVSHA